MEYCNGGHNPPYLISRDGKVERLENIGGLLLGGFKNAEYESKTVNLQPGDTLFLYTDGVIEAKNENKDDFGEEKFATCLENAHGKPLAEIVQKVVTEVQAFSSGSPQTDDMTCLV